MKINELVAHVNRLTDEEGMSATMVVPFINDAIARINAECSADFPYLDVADAESEPVIPEKWQRLLLCTFAAGRVKENDSSQFEYLDFYSQFDASMLEFKAKYAIPEEYKDPAHVGMDTDFNNSYWRWG